MAYRQAVVVIHGMGSQRPRQTVSDAARSSIPPRTKYPDIPPLIARPDKMTHGFDARRYMAQKDEEAADEGTKERLQVEFYEYHWAHMMSGNKFAHVTPLVKRVMLRWPWKLPGKILVFWVLLWALVVVAGFVAWLFKGQLESFDVPAILEAVGVVGVWGFLANQAVRRIGGFVTSSFVDFARYIDPAPENQDIRDRIRSGAVDLLEALHDAKRYDRIVVVAHSQGSVIAYDAITHLWARMNKRHACLENPFRVAMQRLEDAGERLLSETEKADPEGIVIDRWDANEALLDQYRQCQRDAWVEYRKNGNPWLITDLIALGSPLAHAGILVTKSRWTLFESQARMESLTCPPRRSAPSFRGRETWVAKKWAEQKKREPDIKEPTPKQVAEWLEEYKRTEEVPHPYTWENKGTRVYFHGAPFALVRWTALYYSADWFAGPLTENFGAGIRSIKLKPEGLRARTPVWAHTQYLHYKEKESGDTVTSGGAADVLRRELGFDAGPWLISRHDVPDVDPSTGPSTGE